MFSDYRHDRRKKEDIIMQFKLLIALIICFCLTGCGNGQSDTDIPNPTAAPTASVQKEEQPNDPTATLKLTATPELTAIPKQTFTVYEFTDMQSIITMLELAEEECSKKVKEEYELFFDENDDYMKYVNKPEMAERFHSNVTVVAQEILDRVASIYWSGCKFVALQYATDENYDYKDAIEEIYGATRNSLIDFCEECEDIYVDIYNIYENAINVSYDIEELADSKLDELIEQYNQIDELFYGIENFFDDSWPFYGDFMETIYSEFEKGNTDMDSIYDYFLVKPTPVPIIHMTPTPTPIEVEEPKSTLFPASTETTEYLQERAPNDAGYPAYVSIRLKRQESTGINVHEILFYNIETGVEYYVEFNPFNFKHNTLWFEYINLPLGTYEINGGVFQDYVAKYTLYTEENPLTLKEGVQEISCIIGDRDWIKENMDWKWDVDEYRATLPTPTPIEV